MNTTTSTETAGAVRGNRVYYCHCGAVSSHPGTHCGQPMTQGGGAR